MVTVISNPSGTGSRHARHLGQDRKTVVTRMAVKCRVPVDAIRSLCASEAPADSKNSD